MDNVHGTHGTASIVKHPILLEVDRSTVAIAQVINDILNNGASILAVLSQAALRKVIQLIQLENVESIEVLLHENDDRGQQSRQETQDGEQASHSRGAAGAGAFLRTFRHVVSLVAICYRKIAIPMVNPLRQRALPYVQGVKRKHWQLAGF